MSLLSLPYCRKTNAGGTMRQCDGHYRCPFVPRHLFSSTARHCGAASAAKGPATPNPAVAARSRAAQC